ncbi:2-oxoglutarate and Fe(II)-dependent oxygenase superfamily protein, partial [Prunus dulcis]
WIYKNPAALSSRAKNWPPPSRARWRRLRAPLATGPVALEPPSSPLPFPTDPPAAGDLCWLETMKERPELIQNHRNFKASDLPPPATISVDPGTRGPVDPQEGPSKGPISSDHLGDSAEFSAEV